MSEPLYTTQSYIFSSKGLAARYARDRVPDHGYMNLANAQERQENAQSSRYGRTLINTTPGTGNSPLSPTNVHTLGRLKGLQPLSGPPAANNSRYAGAGTNLYRINGDGQGPFTQIGAGLSGNRFSIVVYRPNFSASPYAFFCDGAQMLKDNGTFATAQQMGIFAPLYPPNIALQTYPDNQIFDFDPASGGVSIVNGTMPSVAIISVTRTGGVVTATFAATQNFVMGEGLGITVAGVGDASFDGTFSTTGGTATTATWNQAGVNAIGAGGTLSSNRSVRVYVAANQMSGPYMISSISRSAGVVTAVVSLPSNGGLPTSPFLVGEEIEVSEVGDASFDGGPFVILSLGFIDRRYRTQTVTWDQGGADSTSTGGEISTYGIQTAPIQATIPVGTNDGVMEGMILEIDTGGSVEECIAINVTATSCSCYFTKTHSPGFVVSAYFVQTIIPANSQGTITRVGAIDLSQIEGNPSGPTDTISAYINVSNPANLSEIRLLFDVGDGSFTQDYYYKSLVPISIQSAVDGDIAALSALTGRTYDRSSGNTILTSLGSTNQDLLPTDDPVLPSVRPFQLLPGLYRWTRVTFQLGDFVAVGLAGQPGTTWANVNSFQIQINTAITGSVQIGVDDLYLFGGTGPSSYAGTSYDYRYTYFNNNTGHESNPSTILANSAFLLPWNQPVFVSWIASTDPQVTHVRIYRRGGSLTVGWFMVTQIPIGTITYTDTNTDADIEDSDLLNIDNDVPVTSTLPVNVNTSLGSVAIVSITRAANLVTVNFAAQPNFTAAGLITVEIAGVQDGSFDGTFNLISGTGTTATWTQVKPNATSSGGTFANKAASITIPGTVYTIAPPSMANIYPNQVLTLDTGVNQETIYVAQAFPTYFTAYIQMAHDATAVISGSTRQGTPVNLGAIAYQQAWLAGDPNNPNILYYSKPEDPESFPPENTLEIGTPSSPIMGLIFYMGQLFVFTLTDVWGVLSGGAGVPIPYPTGVHYGLAANFALTAIEGGSVWYQSQTGIFQFNGFTSTYASQMVEWIPRGIGLGPVVPYQPSAINTTVSAHYNNEVYFAYQGTDGNRHRIIYDLVYNRWRNDDQFALSMFEERDLEDLIFGDNQGYVYIDGQGDFDDGGWSGTDQIKIPITFDIETASLDQGYPKAQKVYNEVTLDIDTAGQLLTLNLLFDNGTTVFPVSTSVLSSGRTQLVFAINAGAGYESFNVAMRLTGVVEAAVTVYEWHIRAEVDAEERVSFDTYWQKYGTDGWKIVKQGWFEYQCDDPDGIVFNVFLEGSAIPTFSFTLASSSVRRSVRVRFPAWKFKLIRWIATANTQFQLYSESKIEFKPVTVDKGYYPEPLVHVVPPSAQ
jgi:hypothetical protein